MNPGQAWRVVSLIAVLALATAAALLVDVGYDPLAVTLLSAVVLIAYGYVLYKRYHVEVIPESDLALFDDPDDLRILCRIYGLETDGDEQSLRSRLGMFVNENHDRAFTWVAPKAVLALGSTFEMPSDENAIETRPRPDGGLICGKTRSAARLSDISTCPVCDATVLAGAGSCSRCGADLEFYVALSETKVGKRLLSEKNVAVRRKLRYAVPSLGDKT